MCLSLDEHISDWRDKYVVLLDNCPAHTSVAAYSVMAYLQIPILFSAPASYSAIPVEGVFGALKAIDLDQLPEPNTARISTTNSRKPTTKQHIMFHATQYLKSMPN